jgi:Flp pilus assembly pilin Flp
MNLPFTLTDNREQFRRKEGIRMSHLRVLRGLWRDEAGQDLIEHALIAALVALAAIVAMHRLDKKTSKVFKGIKKTL